MTARWFIPEYRTPSREPRFPRVHPAPSVANFYG